MREETRKTIRNRSDCSERLDPAAVANHPSRYVVTLQPEPSGAHTERRLARLLKAAKRVYGFRCVEVRMDKSEAR